MSRNIADLVKNLKTYSPFEGLEEVLTRLKSQRWDCLYEGDVASVTEFVEWLKITIQYRKPGPRTGAQLIALDIVLCSLIPPLSNPKFLPRFRCVNGVKFVFQLALRIVRPELVNQGGMAGRGICLPTALVNQIARIDPPTFATFAANRFLFGSANLGKLRVSSPPEICGGPNREMSECDYVLLTGFRGMPGAILSYAEVTADLCRYLKSAGYVSIEDHTFDVDGPNYERYFGPRPPGFIWPVNHAGKRAIFDNMVSMIANGRHVFMSIEGEVAHSLWDNRALSHSCQNGPTNTAHTVQLVKLTLHPNDRMHIKFSTWGTLCNSRRHVFYEGGMYIPIFVSRYGGFVSCQYRS